MTTAAIGYMPMPAEFPYRSLFRHGRPRHEQYDSFWRKHPPMDHVHRAKIFSPFDALAGFDDCIAGKVDEISETISVDDVVISFDDISAITG